MMKLVKKSICVQPGICERVLRVNGEPLRKVTEHSRAPDLSITRHTPKPVYSAKFGTFRAVNAVLSLHFRSTVISEVTSPLVCVMCIATGK